MDFFSFVKDKSDELHNSNLSYSENSIWELIEGCTCIPKQDIILGRLPENFDESGFLKDFDASFERLKSGEPLQYITGKAYFRNIELYVNSSVLIPRPETEMLIDFAKSYFSQASIDAKNGLVADICTGSGCIAISIASEMGSTVYATDISNDCINLAKKNAALNGDSENMHFLCGNLCEPLSHLAGTFDCVVSNPPYVPTSVFESLKWTVKNFEPAIAFLAGDDGCQYMAELSSGAYRLLKPSAMFACEIFEENPDVFKGIIENAGFVQAEIVSDLAGRPRFVVAYKN